MGDLPKRWQVYRRAELLWERWAQDAVVFNALSGQTHYLNATARMILERLAEAPQSVDELAWVLARASGAAMEALVPQVQQALEEFEQLGLVEPVV